MKIIINLTSVYMIHVKKYLVRAIIAYMKNRPADRALSSRVRAIAV